MCRGVKSAFWHGIWNFFVSLAALLMRRKTSDLFEIRIQVQRSALFICFNHPTMFPNSNIKSTYRQLGLKPFLYFFKSDSSKALHYLKNFLASFFGGKTVQLETNRVISHGGPEEAQNLGSLVEKQAYKLSITYIRAVMDSNGSFHGGSLFISQVKVGVNCGALILFRAITSFLLKEPPKSLHQVKPCAPYHYLYRENCTKKMNQQITFLKTCTQVHAQPEYVINFMMIMKIGWRITQFANIGTHKGTF